MLTDYKTPSRVHHNDGSWTVRYVVYEGEITTEDEPEGPVTRYRRTGTLRETKIDFSPISEAELIRRLNIRLAQSRTRTPIAEQRNA